MQVLMHFHAVLREEAPDTGPGEGEVQVAVLRSQPLEPASRGINLR